MKNAPSKKFKRYPFSPDLLHFLDQNPDFYNSLRLSNDKGYLLLPLIGLPPDPINNDKIIGLFYAYKTAIINNSLGVWFKQDYIVDLNSEDKDYIGYVAKEYAQGEHVRVVDDFYKQYKDFFLKENYRWHHHYKRVNDLPNYSAGGIKLKDLARLCIAGLRRGIRDNKQLLKFIVSEQRERILKKMLSAIRKNPGIRPSQINRLLNRPHTASFRNALIKRGLVRKQRKGSSVHYYPA